MNKKIKGISGKEYSVIREIGSGGFGVVYLVKSVDGKEYAVKVLPIGGSPQDKLSFTQELKSTAGLDHPNLLTPLDSGDWLFKKGLKGKFIVMDYCAEGNYRKRISPQLPEISSLNQIVSDFIQLLAGLEALHTRIVHRDLKPENVLVSHGVLRITDFGLAKFVEEATRSMTFKGSGTPVYMAPEVWEGVHVLPATDLYSIGIMLFEGLTGQVPFREDDIFRLRDLHRFQIAPRTRTINPNIPVFLDRVVSHLLEKDFNRRYQSAAEVLSDLRKVNQSEQPPDTALSKLAERVQSHQDRVEEDRLTTEAHRNHQADELARLTYMERQLLGMFEECIDELNRQLPGVTISSLPSREGGKFQLGNRVLYIHFFRYGELLEDAKIQNQRSILTENNVMHGGYIEIREDGEDKEGWNFVLLRNPENEYGEWKLFETRANALTGHAFRNDIAAIEAKLFAENLHYHFIHAMHVYNLKGFRLDRDQILRILEVFIPSAEK